MDGESSIRMLLTQRNVYVKNLSKDGSAKRLLNNVEGKISVKAVPHLLPTQNFSMSLC